MELISKIEGALQELEESVYWLELLIDASIVKVELLTDLLKEADELTAILVTSAKTVKQRSHKPRFIIHHSRRGDLLC